jgi:activator of HSP90 ATPase
MNHTKNIATEPKRPARREMLSGAIAALSGIVLASSKARASDDGSISHTAEAIHQDVSFTASPKRVYDALTDAKQFQRVIEFSDAMKSHIPAGAPPAQISTEPGGAFSTFGGIIVGRQIELFPGQRIVQAWRVSYWDPGAYSIVKFELAADGAGTKLTLDHRGFPDGDAQHLLEGWSKNYWEPMRKFFAQA